MVNRKMTAGQVLSLVRKLARGKNLTVQPLKGRGKGSHEIHVLLDSHGTEVARFAVTGSSKDMSWTVLRSIEAALGDQFGEKWMEK